MLTAIKRMLRNRRDRQELENLSVMMANIHPLLFPENPTTGALVRMKTGLFLRQRFENRFGIMGPDLLEMVGSDYDLQREATIIDKLTPQQLEWLCTEQGRLAGRITLEGGGPDEWNEDEGEDTKQVGRLLALRLLEAWFKCKYIVHTSTNRKVIKKAQDWEGLFFDDIQRLQRLLRGEPAIKEGER